MMMTMRIVSKKALAILLSIAILVSCMVFSFSVSATDTLLWENDFNDGTATNWLAGYQQANRAWASGKVNPTYGYATNLSDYDVTNKAMAMKFIGDASRYYMTGFTVLHKEATNANTGEYGYHGGVTEAGRADKGMFLPTKGTYTVSFDYKVESFSTTAGAAADICVGFSAYNKWYWWSSTALRQDFINATNKGVYEVAATVNASTANTWQTATVVIDQPLDDTMLMHIFSRSNDEANRNLDGTTVLVDNIKVYRTEGGSGTPDPNESAKRWENNFNDGTASNWLAGYQQTNHAWASGSAANQSVYDATNKAMAMKFTGENSRNYLTGFTVLHKEATNVNTGEYGYHGGVSDAGRIQKGMFLPTKGTYTVSFDYKVESFSTTAGAAADICVGFATYESWYWWNSAAKRLEFMEKGVYEVAATVNADTENTWQTATVVIDQPLDNKMLMHIFSVDHVGAYKNLDGTTILVDNVVVYEGDIVAGETPDVPDTNEDGLFWENNFDDGTATNWLASYQQTNHAWASGSAANQSFYDAANKAMTMKFTGEKSRYYLTGFTMLHKEATNANTGKYGYHGGVSNVSRIQAGMFLPTRGTYTVSFDYKVESFSATAGAAVDICVGFAAYESWYWWNSSAKRLDFMEKGVYEVAATVNASTENTWQTVNITVDQPLDDKMLMHIFSMTHVGADRNLDGTTILVDNVKVREWTPGLGFVAPDDFTQEIKMWENNFNNPSDTNWKEAYERANHAWATNSSTNHAVYNVESQAMELKFKSLQSTNYLSGFTVLHKDTTHGTADIAGYHGGESDSSYTRIGMFRPESWRYRVKLKYNVTAFSDTEGAAMDLCVGFADRNTWKWWKEQSMLVNYTSEGEGKGTYFLMETVDASDVGTGWHEVEIEINQNVEEARLMHIFATGKMDDKKNINGATVLIDDIEVYKVATDENFTDVSFYYNGTKIGQSKKALPGIKFEVPRLDMPLPPVGYKVVYYSDAACSQLVDLPSVYPQTPLDLYVRVVYNTGNVWGFETEPDNSRLSLNQPADTTIYTDDAVKHTGDAAARVDAPNVVGKNDAYPQMMVQNAYANTIEVDKGRDYEVRFWLYVPENQSIGSIKYWLTATNDENAFETGADATYLSKNFMIAEGTKTITAKGQWIEVVVPVTDCAYSGKLRIGIAGDATAAHTFYIDDIAVLSQQSDPNAWGFDSETVGTRLSLNSRIPQTTICVDNSYVYTGRNAARVNSDGGGSYTNLLAQMLVKNSAGEQVRVYKNRSYEIKFYVFIPNDQVDYDLTYWFAATDNDNVFDSNYDNGAHTRKNCTVASGTYDLSVGEWTEVVVKIANCPYTGKLRIGLNGNSNKDKPFYIDELSVNEVTTDPIEGVESFELYGDGHKLSLNTDGAEITVSDDDRHNGEYSAQITSIGKDVNAAPQMVVNNELTKPIVIEKGKSYRVSFWITQPIHDADYDIKYWLAVTDSDTAFTNERKNVVLDTKTIVTADKHVWQKVSAEINDVAYSGKLRLGITADADGVHTFYVDDILVKEIQPSNMDAMNFENYDIGTNLSLTSYRPYTSTENTSIIITDEESYTGSQSAHFHAKENVGENSPHLNVKDAYGNQVKVKKGTNFYVSFRIMIPVTESYFSLYYWATAVPDDVLEKPYYYDNGTATFPFGRQQHMLYERRGVSAPEAGVWTEIKIPVMDCPRDGNLRIGITHYNQSPFESNFYIDDIRVYEPEYILVKFDTNGSEDKFDDVLIMSEMTVPYDGIDPYREGYEFLGWYTSKEYNKDAYFDIYNTPVIGKTGDVLTLYAHWRKWEDPVASGDKNKQDKYKTEYYTDEVWVENQTVMENPYPGGEFNYKESDSVVVNPDDRPAPEPEGGMPPWLIVVIIIAAVVVVGGGATLATILLKKNKKA